MKSGEQYGGAELTGSLLIAAPSMDDAHFVHSVVLVCEHNSDGAFGLIVNKLLMGSFSTLKDDFEIPGGGFDIPVFYGGPVKPEYGYVIYEPFSTRYGAMKVTREIAVSASREILHDIAKGEGPRRHLFALGFAGWGPEQLEEELMQDVWIVAPARSDVIFDVPIADRWKHAAGMIGVDFGRYSDRFGNA